MTSIFIPDISFEEYQSLITPKPDLNKLYKWLGVVAVALVIMQITLPKK